VFLGLHNTFRFSPSIEFWHVLWSNFTSPHGDFHLELIHFFLVVFWDPVLGFFNGSANGFGLPPGFGNIFGSPVLFDGLSGSKEGEDGEFHMNVI